MDENSQKQLSESGVRRQQRFERLLALTKVLNSDLDVDRVLETIMDTVIDLTRADRGFLVLLDEESFRVATARNIRQEDLLKPEFKFSRSIVREVARECNAMLCTNAQDESTLRKFVSVQNLQLRSVLCAPLMLKERCTGVLYLDNRFVEGRFTEEDRELLEAFADHAALALENARLHRAALQQERLERELSIARQIQQGLLPEEMPRMPGWNIHGLSLPARHVGGDYFDFIFPPDRNSLYVCMGDVAGKGVPAALVAVQVRGILHEVLRHAPAPLEALIHLNQALCRDSARFATDYLLFVSMVLARLTPDSGHVELGGAGHEHLLHRSASRAEVFTIPCGGMVLGIEPDIRPHLNQTSLELGAGDQLVLYSDGVTDARNTGGESFSLERLTANMQETPEAASAELCEGIRAAAEEFCQGAEAHDDWTLVAMRRTD